jgi:membrane-bound ClpP family serine protease
MEDSESNRALVESSGRKLQTRVRSWLKLLLLLLDDVLVVFLVVFVLWRLGVDFQPWVLALLVSLFIVLLFVMHKLLMPALVNTGSGDPTGLIGEEGDALTPLGRKGLVRVRGEVWKAKAKGRDIQVGERIVVADTERLGLIVEPGMSDAD